MLSAAFLTLAATLPSASPPSLRVAVLAEIPADTGWTASRVDRTVADVASEWIGVDVVNQATLFAGGQGTPVRNCGADVVCLGKELRYVGVDFVVLMVASRLEPELRLVLRLVEVESASTVASKAGAWAPNEAGDMARRVREIFAYLPRPRAAFLALSSMPEDAELAVTDRTGNVVRRGAGRHRLEPAPYMIDAQRDGYVPRQARIDLAPGMEAKHHVELEVSGGQWYASPWFWGVVIGVAAVGATVGIAVATSGGEQCLCLGRDPDTCPPPC